MEKKEYYETLEKHNELFPNDEYFNFSREIVYEKEIKILKKSIEEKKPIKYEDLGFSKEEAEKIRNGEISI